MKAKISVLLEVPDGANIQDCANYVLDAVKSWKGSYRPPGSYDDNDPGDPMFGLDQDKVILAGASRR